MTVSRQKYDPSLLHSFKIEIAHCNVGTNVVCVGYESPDCRNKFLKLKINHFYRNFKF
jgi:hypothetical protein